MSNVFDSLISRNDDAQEDNSQAAQKATADSAPQSSNERANFDSDSDGASKTPREVREITQELLRHGYIEESRKSDWFRRAVIHQNAINGALQPLDLELQLDQHRGVAFLKVGELEDTDSAGDQAWSHPLVRRQRLTLEQSLLVAFLRQAFIVHEQETGVGESPARIAVEDLLPQFLTYFEDSGSDAKNESRLLSLLDQLKTHGVVSEVDKNQELTIRPLIAHLANPESLTALLETLQQQTEHANQLDRKGDELLEDDSHE